MCCAMSRGMLVAPSPNAHTGTFVSSLRETVGPDRWSVWFEGATDFHITDGGLTVGVANLFIGNHLKNNFIDLLHTTAKETFGQSMPIAFHVQPDLFQKRRRENLEDEADAMETLEAPPASEPARASVPRPVRTSPFLFTLESFVVGPSNQMAYAAVRSAVAAPGREFHPLFIHAGCGLGKTHLLQALVAALAPRSDLRVACVSAEKFTNQYLAGMRTQRLDAFRYRYRNLDVLAIDDVHFLANKSSTQQEFLHTFNELDDQGRLVVLASDSHPREIQAVRDHLVSRWVSGLVVRMTPPERDTRRLILEKKAVQMKHPLPPEVLDLLADRLRGSVRDLEGALTRLVAYAALLKAPVTPDLARQVVAELAVPPPATSRLGQIEQAVTDFFGVTPSDLRSRSKTRPITLARQLTMYLARELTDLSQSEVARGLGSKHHTTVLSACRKWQERIDAGEEVAWTDRSGRRTMSAKALVTQLLDRVRR